MQFGQQSRVGGGKFMRGQLRFLNPFQSGAIQRLRFAGKQFAAKKFQVDGLFGIVVPDFLEQFANGNLRAQFLADFADEALLKAFARLAFAAGKFPQPAEMRICVTLRDEEFAFAENQSRRNFHDVMRDA